MGKASTRRLREQVNAMSRGCQRTRVAVSEDDSTGLNVIPE